MQILFISFIKLSNLGQVTQSLQSLVFLIHKNEESNSHLFRVASGFKGDNVREGDMYVIHCSIKIRCCHHMGFLRSSERLSVSQSIPGFEFE